MGVVVAWPRELFELKDSEVVRVSDTIDWPKKPKTKKRKGEQRWKHLDVWHEVRRRQPKKLAARLRASDSAK